MHKGVDTMKSFTLSVPISWNYTPTDLMIKYAKEHYATEFKRIWLHSCLIINGIVYKYDSWHKFKVTSTNEIVTVYLKELKQ